MANDLNNLENLLDVEELSEQTSGSSQMLFDNPLLHKILTVEHVAKLFGKSVRWVKDRASDGSLPCHYAGSTPMFHLDQVVQAFLADSLEKRRRTKHDTTKTKKERRDFASSHRQSKRNGTLKDILRSEGSSELD